MLVVSRLPGFRTPAVLVLTLLLLLTQSALPAPLPDGSSLHAAAASGLKRLGERTALSVQVRFVPSTLGT